MPEKFVSSSDYTAWLDEVKSRIVSARISVARSVNRELILLYWDIGQGTLEKKKELGWGDAVVDQLAFDLREAFPHERGFLKQNVWRMRQFYVTYSSAEFLSQAVRELVAAVPWGHHANALAVVTECIADSVILHLIKQLLKAPEVERGKDGKDGFINGKGNWLSNLFRTLFQNSFGSKSSRFILLPTSLPG